MSICGSYGYIPPEVALEEPYNETCDVYSFAVVLWEMLALKPAFGSYKNDQDFIRHVFYAPFKRPLLKTNWPTTLQVLLHSSWHPTPARRPSMKHVEDCLKKEQLLLTAQRRGNEDEEEAITNHHRRRSTFVFQWNSESSLRNRLYSMSTTTTTTTRGGDQNQRLVSSTIVSMERQESDGSLITP
jgi:serine/threonine protein kinase